MYKEDRSRPVSTWSMRLTAFIPFSVSVQLQDKLFLQQQQARKHFETGAANLDAKCYSTTIVCLADKQLRGQDVEALHASWQRWRQMCIACRHHAIDQSCPRGPQEEATTLLDKSCNFLSINMLRLFSRTAQSTVRSAFKPNPTLNIVSKATMSGMPA